MVHPSRQHQVPRPALPSKSAPLPDCLPSERRELAPLQNAHAGPSRSPIDFSREAVPTGLRHIAPLPRRDFDPPYLLQQAYPLPPPLAPYPAYPLYNWYQPFHPPTPYPAYPRSAEFDQASFPPQQQAFPLAYHTDAQNARPLEHRHHGYDERPIPSPHQQAHQNRYSATYVTPVHALPRPSDRELHEMEMARVEADLAQILRSNLRR